jgi:hypothetical protein
MRSFPYKPREPRVPPEAPEPEAPAAQDRKFLVRMLVFVALAFWIMLRVASRFAVGGAAGHPLGAPLMFGDALFSLVLVTSVLPWVSKNNLVTRHLKESFLTTLAIFSSVFLMGLVLVLFWITLGL